MDPCVRGGFLARAGSYFGAAEAQKSRLCGWGAISLKRSASDDIVGRQQRTNQTGDSLVSPSSSEKVKKKMDGNIYGIRKKKQLYINLRLK